MKHSTESNKAAAHCHTYNTPVVKDAIIQDALVQYYIKLHLCSLWSHIQQQSETHLFHLSHFSVALMLKKRCHCSLHI